MGAVATGGFRRGGAGCDMGVVGSFAELAELQGSTGSFVHLVDPLSGSNARKYVWDGAGYIPADFWRDLLLMQGVVGSFPGSVVTVPHTMTATGGAATQITNGILIDKLHPAISYSSDMQISGASGLDLQSISGKHVFNGTTRASSFFSARFVIDCQEVEVRYKHDASPRLRMLYREQGGQWIQTQDIAGVGNNGSTYRVTWTFPSATVREICIQFSNQGWIHEYVISQNGTIFPAPNNSFRTMVIGDSYTEGASGVSGVFGAHDTWSVKMAQMMGWQDHWVSALGGTGYLTEFSGRPAVLARINTDIVAYRPDLIITALGINDAQSSEEALYQAVLQYIQTIKAGHPQSVIGFVTAWNPRSTGDSRCINAVNRAVTATRIGSCFVVDGAIFTGTGRSGTPLNDGNSDRYVAADGAHPTFDGHEYIANRVRSEITRIARTRALP
jgi:lysophospholipase L1-like esterase